MGKNGNRVFHLGKGFENDDQRTPMRGEPNTNLDTREKATGKLHSRRKFGADGKAVKDLDVGSDVHADDHAHDIIFDGSKPDRQLKRNLSKKEQREINKAKKKRRSPKNDR